jgi:hypothetical protein
VKAHLDGILGAMSGGKKGTGPALMELLRVAATLPEADLERVLDLARRLSD